MREAFVSHVMKAVKMSQDEAWTFSGKAMPI